MKYLLRSLGFIWLLPATILVWTFYISWAWAFGLIKWNGWHSFLIARFLLVNEDSWYARLWRDWGGWSGPCVIIMKERYSLKGEKHEERHCLQQFLLGLFFYPTYALDSVFLWLLSKSCHAYLDNIFERDARDYAGQLVNVPPDKWPQGPSDRWPWW